jgi:hypothetical protein
MINKEGVTWGRSFVLNEKQLQAFKLFEETPAKQVLLYGGRQSGKTILCAAYMIMGALTFIGSKQLVVRFQRTDLDDSTIPAFYRAFELLYGNINNELDPGAWDPLEKVLYGPPMPGGKRAVLAQWRITKQCFVFKNGSLIKTAGLLGKDLANTEKGLGKSFFRLFFDELSEVPNAMADTVDKLLPGLTQSCTRPDTGAIAKNFAMFCMNPPVDEEKWMYRRFILFKSNDGRRDVEKKWLASLEMNPKDNEENLPPDYEAMFATMSEEERDRELYGAFGQGRYGRIFQAWMEDCVKEGRVLPTIHLEQPYILNAVFDIGNDMNCCWICKFNEATIDFVGYEQAKGCTLEDFIPQVQSKYPYINRVFLPFDAWNKNVATGQTPAEVVYRIGISTKDPAYRFYVGKVHRPVAKWAYINSARNMFPRCVFGKDNCNQGINLLKLYKYSMDREGMFRDAPVHNIASHCADAFQYVSAIYVPSKPLVKVKDDLQDRLKNVKKGTINHKILTLLNDGYWEDDEYRDEVSYW